MPHKPLITGTPDNPILHLGWDLGLRRDTAAIAATFRDPRDNMYCLWSHRIWEPPVRVADCTNYVMHLLTTQNVGGIHADPWQLIGELQKLEDAGFGHLIHEVNQSSESVAFSNCLKGHLDDGSFAWYEDSMLMSHFKWCNVEVGERGWRIVKRHQSRPIDAVVAIAMSLYGATQDAGISSTRTYSDSAHRRSLKYLA